MSHAYGEIIIGQEVVGYYEYNGTCDVVISHIYDTLEEVQENWRSGRWRSCTCGAEPTDALIYTSYGSGYYWPGKVCLQCRAVVKGLDPFPDQADDGMVRDGHPLDREGGDPVGRGD